MVQALKARVRIQPGGRVEVQDASLPVGSEAEIIIMVPSVDVGEQPLSLAHIIGSGKGGFASVDEIDQYLRDLRDEWD